MDKDEILAELELLVEERKELNQTQDDLVELTRNNREMYEKVREDIENSSEPFTKLREYELEERWNEILQKENKFYMEIEMYRLVINKRRDELVEQLKELAQN